jgi:hypothetical protein
VAGRVAADLAAAAGARGRVHYHARSANAVVGLSAPDSEGVAYPLRARTGFRYHLIECGPKAEGLPEPADRAVVFLRFDRCARCGKDHAGADGRWPVVAYRFGRPGLDSEGKVEFTHFAFCPETGVPIAVKLTDDAGLTPEGYEALVRERGVNAAAARPPEGERPFVSRGRLATGLAGIPFDAAAPPINSDAFLQAGPGIRTTVGPAAVLAETAALLAAKGDGMGPMGSVESAGGLPPPAAVGGVTAEGAAVFGAQAAREGLPATANPHPEGSAEHASWDAGHKGAGGGGHRDDC